MSLKTYWMIWLKTTSENADISPHLSKMAKLKLKAIGVGSGDFNADYKRIVRFIAVL